METEKPKHSTPVEQRVPAGQKIAYGAGGLSDFLYLNLVNAMAVPIFSTVLHMDSLLLAVALVIPKIVGSLLDPMVGAWSDNFHSPWGRRRPFILAGGVAGAILLPFIWMPPSTSQPGMFLWLGGLLVPLAIFYTVFNVPYNALGYQLTADYDERTRVLTWRGYILTAGTLCAAWFYHFCKHPIFGTEFGSEVIGVRWLSVVVGLIIIGGVVATVLGPREKIHAVEKQTPIPLWPALKMTLRNRSFLILQLTILIIAIGTGCEGFIGNYVHVHYTCGGDTKLAAEIIGWGGTLTVLANLAALSLGLWISTRSGKRTAAMAGLALSLLAVCLLPFTLVKETPYLIIVSWVILALGMPAASLMFGSMTADITDEDELATGHRREGMYVAVAGMVGKVAAIVSLLLGGLLPRLAGYVDNVNIPPTEAQLGSMRIMLIGIQVVAILAAIIVICFFPLTRARSEEVRRLLDERGRARTPDPA